MASIRGKGNLSTEKRLIKILQIHRIKGWRRNHNLLGKPDFVFPKNHVAVFVDGCFWHGCPKCYKEPKKNVDFWREKIRRNIARDKKNSRKLRENGWSVLRLREHSLGNSEAVSKRILVMFEK